MSFWDVLEFHKTANPRVKAVAHTKKWHITTVVFGP
jgi:hypothetical protein